MNQFRVPNGLKPIKRTSSGLIGSFNIIKIRNFLRDLFFYKTFLLLLLLKSPRDKSVTFHIEVPLMENLFYRQMKPNEQNKSFSRN